VFCSSLPFQDVATLTAAKELLEAKKDIRFGAWKNDDIDILNEQQFLTAKPVVYLVNIGNEEYALQKNKYLAKVGLGRTQRSGGVAQRHCARDDIGGPPVL